MAHDFRTVATAVKNTVKEMDARDPNWKWTAKVQKRQVKIFWSYLDYGNSTPPFTITDGSREEGSTDDDFIVLRDEHGRYLSGRILGYSFSDDGSLEDCVVSLMRALQQIVNSTY